MATNAEGKTTFVAFYNDEKREWEESADVGAKKTNTRKTTARKTTTKKTTTRRTTKKA